jgi:GNAT superfamily N-acetyltransferase
MKKRLPRLPDDVLPKLQIPVRRLVSADRPAVLDYYRRLSMTDRAAHFGHPLSDDKLALYVHRLDFDADGHFAAIGAASVMVGVAHCAVFDGQGVASSHVALGYRRRGIGQHLGSTLIDFARSRGLNWLRAYFSKGDPIAAALARRCGLQLHVGLDRFYAEIRLATSGAGAAALRAARAESRFTDCLTASAPAAAAPPVILRGRSAPGQLSQGAAGTACHAVGRKSPHRVA